MNQPETIYLKDYTPFPFDLSEVEMTFDIHHGYTMVTTEFTVESKSGRSESIQLHGLELDIVDISINGDSVARSKWQLSDEGVVLELPSSNATLSIITRLVPEDNTALEGLYRSSTMYCTQCEAEGFRRITLFPDRPDVMTTYKVTLIADKASCPVLLGNGNEVASGEVDAGRHFATWHDPHPKPSYLFAVVAGDLHHVEDTFTTRTGTDVTLRIFVEEKDLDKTAFAMDALKRSMKWDEERYGREYDLSIFNVVAVDDFNMGAMENKSLNIFNSACVLAKPETTVDAAFQRIEAIVAHEYFHNWSGNRVTCRDWFQLSLKEGFTVFRDSQFSSDMGSSVVKRIEDVSLLRSKQFSEDAGPLSHPVRPASYIEISNFYTLTVYEKGAEVVRMIHTLLGEELFRKGSDLYFDRHDGQAATIEDFIAAMSEVSGRDFSQFMNWYSQSGTPHVEITETWDGTHLQLIFKQKLRDGHQPHHIPIQLAVLGEAGMLPISHAGVETADNTEWVYELTEREAVLQLGPYNEKPVASVFRGFSAPVVVDFNQPDDERFATIARDSDAFNRWDNCQKFYLEYIKQASEGQLEQLNGQFIDSLKALLSDESLEAAFKAQVLKLPSTSLLLQGSELAPIVIAGAIDRVSQLLAESLEPELAALISQHSIETEYHVDAVSIGKRDLRNTALAMTARLGDLKDARRQFVTANNMTDQFAALSVLYRAGSNSELETFFEQWKDDALVMNMWLSLQAKGRKGDNLSDVIRLTESECFDFKNPNKVRSVLGVFSTENIKIFHAQDGSGYEYLADIVIQVDQTNPQLAARLIAPLCQWRNFVEEHAMLMRGALTRVGESERLSKDVYELVSKSL